MSIFKAYDIRGLVPEELNADLAYQIGRAAASHFPARRFMVGTDDRSSRQIIFEAFTRGLRDQGADVVHIGKVSTPILYFSVAHHGFDAGVMITASHNPGKYNGFKFCLRDAAPVPSEELQQLRRRVEEADFAPLASAGGSLTDLDPFPAYRCFLAERMPLKRSFRMVMDAGNGVCGLFALENLACAPLEIEAMYFESDPSFPNHEPNPLEPQNTADLRKRVLETGAELGVALDGDGDRVMLIDEKGQFLQGDITTLLIALGLKESGHSNFNVLIDCRSSRAVAEILQENGLSVTPSRVGHTFIKTAMRKHNSLCGGELSGHYYFADSHYTENTDLALFTILKMMETSGKKLSELTEPLMRYSQSGEINSEVADVAATLAKIRSSYSDAEFSEIDGLTVEYKDWWFNLRPSNTEPKLRLNLEASSPAMMAEKRDEVLAVIRG